MRPFYKKKPIGSVNALCAALRISESALKHLAANLDRHYTPFEIPKDNGKRRALLIPSLHLKTLQKRINREIFSHVAYPAYLYGGVENRDYVKNASVHQRAEVLIALDVKDFYPSIEMKQVVSIFQHLFKFPKEVADILARLTTYEGKVPQGACTSSHIANLVLHDVEYHIAQDFHNRNYVYTRLLDDICVSSLKPLSPEKVEDVIKKVSSMVKKKGLKLRAAKTRITSRSNPESLMEVTGLWLNRGTPRVNPKQRRSIRSAVYQCQKTAMSDNSSLTYHVEHASASGKVAMLKYLKYGDATRMRTILQGIVPVYDKAELTKTKKIVDMLCRTSHRDREKYAYSLGYHKAKHRINIVSRTEPMLAHALRAKLKKCPPTKTRSEMIYDESI